MLLIIGLSLLCGFLIRDMEAGKGKGGRNGHIIIQNELKGQNNLVPIYMPIPIPIPMPVNNEVHKFQSAHRDDHEGEIKKIYLLQPVPKIHHQPPATIKGGGFPVQTHIHMAPARHAPVDQQRALGGHAHESQENQQRGKHHEPDMKILPIVLIPPIAPVPQLNQASGSQSYGSRMTLTPQFNNYVVASTEPTVSTKTRGLYQQHVSSTGEAHFAQDERNFGDYGGGVGGAFYRETFGPRLRASGRSSFGSHKARASQLRRSYRRPVNEPLDHVEDQPNDVEEPAEEAPPMRRIVSQPTPRRGRRTWIGHQGGYRRVQSPRQASSSIRDIINEQQQAVAFDEPCCQSGGRQNQIRSSASSFEPATDQQLADGMDLAEPDYPSPTRSLSFHSNQPASRLGDSDHQLYHHRAHQDQQPLASHYSHHQHQEPNDEWWFDSIKSVTHVSGQDSNVTYAMVQNDTNKLLSKETTTTTTTTQPPSGESSLI